MNRMDRLFAILLQLQARGQQRAVDLAATFEVSVRTIYRDVQALSEAGIPVVAMPGQGYALSEGYFLPPLTFTALEASALALGAGYVAQTLDAPFRAAAQAAQAKISSALSEESRRELQQMQEAVRFVQPDGQPELPYLRQLREAIVDRRLLRITYHTYGRSMPEERDVEPYGLIHHGLSWHLFAYCRSREAPRIFRLDRLDAVIGLPERFERNRGLSASVRPPEPSRMEQEVRVRAALGIVRWLREEHRRWLVEERLEGEHALLIFRVRDRQRLARQLLGWGAAIEVLYPPELRAEIAEQGRRLAQRHTGPAQP